MDYGLLMIDDRDEPAAGSPPPEIRSKLASFDTVHHARHPPPQIPNPQSRIPAFPHELGSFDKRISANWVRLPFRASDLEFPGPAGRLASFVILPSSCPLRRRREHRARRVGVYANLTYLHLNALGVSVVDVVSTKIAHLLISWLPLRWLIGVLYTIQTHPSRRKRDNP